MAAGFAIAPAAATEAIDVPNGSVAVEAGLSLPPGMSAEDLVRRALASAGTASIGRIVIDSPLDESLYPPEIVAPTFRWHDEGNGPTAWLVEIAFAAPAESLRALTRGEREPPEIDWRCVSERFPYEEEEYAASARAWTPGDALWERIKRRSVAHPAEVTIRGLRVDSGGAGSVETVSRGRVRIATSVDPVGATLFYRDVPLMPTTNAEGTIQPLDQSMFPLIEWRLRDISRPRSRVVMDHLPTCANCHSFPRDGGTLAMDMDSPSGDKGAFVVQRIEPHTVLERDDVFSWNRFGGRPPDSMIFGLFSQISPDGRHVATMVNEEIFVANYMDFRFLQTFYPTRGILAYRDLQSGEIRSLPGADDPAYVQANPAWSPDGEWLVFLRAPARPAYGDAPRPTYANDPLETPILYDLYRIPFDEGRGGVAVPIAGASGNGMSNSFPRVSPDGRWIVFVQARNGLLMRPDSQLYIVPAEGGAARRMRCNTERMNSYHSWSPNGRWLVFSSKAESPYTRMYLTHVDELGRDTPAVVVPHPTAANRAVNLPDFVALDADDLIEITTPAVDYRRHLDRGRELWRDGDVDAALEELRTSIELKPDYWDSHLALGDALAGSGRPEEAIEAYRRSLELHPGYYSTHNNLGVVLSRVGRLDEAIEAFRSSLEIHPGQVVTYNNLGSTLAAAGRPEQAIPLFERALEIDPRSERAHYEWGIAAADTGDLAMAIERFRSAASLDPAHLGAWLRLGDALVATGRPEDALMPLRRAVQLGPRSHSAYERLARLLAVDLAPARRDPEEAVRLATTACALSRNDEPRDLATLAAAHAAGGRFDAAQRIATRALELARRLDRPDLARRIERQLERYRSRQAPDPGEG